MNKIKDTFLIQDLETLSGIKAHTIRIWEKRYAILNPDRLNRNIRRYSLADLQKLLNLSVLYKNGFKISKLSKLPKDELLESAREIGLKSIESNYHLNEIVFAMYSFDSLSFEKIYSELIEKMSFDNMFVNIFMPLMHRLGVLWQTDAIKPIHEHFLSNLIIGKISLNTANINVSNESGDKTYILFLPEGEMHNFGLLFLNYCLKIRGKNTIYLGGSIPFSNLEILKQKFSNVDWICSFVLNRTQEDKKVFLNKYSSFLREQKGQGFVVGWIWDDFELVKSFTNVNFCSSFKELPYFD
jgi:DNA-binding transcriptional MerR regulator